MCRTNDLKNYTEEFRQAVDLYRSTPRATLRGIAADLGISRHTLHPVHVLGLRRRRTRTVHGLDRGLRRQFPGGVGMLTPADYEAVHTGSDHDH